MVIVQLAGGLGNQMFQYAAGRAISHQRGVPLLLDLDFFKRDAKRQYRLKHFGIEARIASQSDIDRVRGWGWRGLPTRLRQRLNPDAPYFAHTVFIEQHHHYDPNFWRASKTVYLVGYWQSERYFANTKELIRRELALCSAPDTQNQSLLHKIAREESVCVHVRRGDYISDSEINRIHGVCSLDYYRAAIDVMVQKLCRPHFFVFSDDMKWTTANLKIDYPCTYVDHNGADRDFEDFRLMTHCDHHIIANSSFSWWGAWLSNHPQRIVIAPRSWFATTEREMSDLIPETWVTI